MRALALLLALLAAPLAAQERIPSHCVALADGPETLQHASFREPVARDSVRITYLDHAMFLIQDQGGLSAATDFTGYIGNVDFLPDIVTMNHAHGTHWTPYPDPAIPHVLRGWGEGRPADHYLDMGTMLVRNVTTDIRGRFGQGVEADGNSIFVFEVAGLCIGHMGHLHHEPSPAQYARLGRMDVVMIAVDGGLTLDLPTVLRVLERLEARLVLPMHWFGLATLDAFLAGMADTHQIEVRNTASLTVDRESLPDTPTVVVLRPELLSE